MTLIVSALSTKVHSRKILTAENCDRLQWLTRQQLEDLAFHVARNVNRVCLGVMGYRLTSKESQTKCYQCFKVLPNVKYFNTSTYKIQIA